MPITKEDIYSERLVCFIDILGFKEKIEETRCGKDLGTLRNITNTIWGISSYTERMIPGLDLPDHPEMKNFYDIQWGQFSDSVIISVGVLGYDSFLWFFRFLQRISYIMLEYDVVVRGGITYGDVFHKGNQIFGPAMNDAYILECKRAFYPRIILDSHAMRVVEEAENEAKSKGDSIINKCLAFDPDFPYIDFICKNFQVREEEIDNLRELHNRLRVVVSKYATHPEASVRAKYSWIEEKIPCLDTAIKTVLEKIEQNKIAFHAARQKT